MSLDIVAEIIAKTAHCKIEDVKPDVELKTLGLGSLDTITILFELEEAFDIEIPNEIIPEITTVNDILNNLDKINH
ncbi:MAG: acyl carrier protein [Gammaproteobacteria bacterium]|jgi:acyl carrier protein|nr:acyl carrier protein [Pseudomonadota bacterium]NOR42582.1 acyl carrier protein [Gammaproteobacteria bacterium]